MRFATWLIEQRYAESTIDNYVRMVGRLERFVRRRGGPPVREVSWEDFRSFADTLPQTSGSLGMLRGAMLAYWRFLDRDERKSPAWRLRVPKKPPPMPNPMSDEELDRVFSTASHFGPRYYAVTCCLYYLGIRRAELARLRWNAFREDGWVRILGKGNRERWVPAHPAVIDALSRIPRRGEYVFPGRWGGHICEGTVNLWITQIQDTSGVLMYPHRFRHTCLTNALDRTRDLAAVQEFAGHAKPETTRVYTRVNGERLRSVSAVL